MDDRLVRRAGAGDQPASTKKEDFCYKSRFWGDIIVVCGARCFVPIVLDAEGPIYWGKTHDIVIPARRLLHKSSALLSLHQPEPRTVEGFERAVLAAIQAPNANNAEVIRPARAGAGGIPVL